MRMIKLCVITFLVLEILAFLVHFNELLNYIGNVFMAFIPIFIIIVAVFWMIRAMFR